MIGTSVRRISADLIAESRLGEIARSRGHYPYAYLDGIALKRTWGGEVRNVSLLVAIGVADDGYRDILGIVEGCKEDNE